MKATKTNMPIKTLQVRVRDRHAALLSRMAFEVNQVWNLANEASYEAWHVPVPEVGYIQGVWRSAFDIQKDILPIRKARGFILPSHTVQQVVAEHAARRRQFKTSKLRWRASSGSRRALGWIPFKKGSAKWVNGQVRFAGHYFRVWDSYGLADYEFRAGSFVQDARGRWYFSVSVEYQPNATPSRKAVGVDLGLKDTATCSDGAKLKAGRFYRDLEDALGKAQRTNKAQRVRAIHAKIRNRRKDAIHKFTTHLAERYGVIFVGDVSSAKLVKTKMAKSVLDAGWHQLKTQLKYKAIARSGVFEEVNEAYSTQVCSCCGATPDSSPKGRAGLGIRHWICSECGAEHDRDINAAKNILAAGGASPSRWRNPRPSGRVRMSIVLISSEEKMKKIKTVFLMLGLLGLAACSERPETVTMPKVNNENCRHENVMKMEPEALRQKFASLCLRRSAIKPSDKPKTWGPGDI